MMKTIEYIRNNYFAIACISIFLLAAFLRFYNFTSRISLSADESGFFLVARHAVLTHQLPLLGPFSSAGPFQTGGEWYWLVMVGTLLNINYLFSPWIFMTLLSLVSVILAFYVGKLTFGKNFGLLFGLLVAVSPSEISQSIGLTNQTPIGLLSLLSLCFGILFLKKKENIYGFWMTFFIGLAASIHLQGIALIPFAIIVFIARRKFSIKTILAFLIGFLIPWIPVFISDLDHNFFTFRNMFYYIFLEKNKIPYELLGRRWLTFIGSYVPSAWGYVIGGYTILGYVLVLLVGVASIYSFFTKKISTVIIVILVSTIAMFAVVRYTRTPLFDSYIMFLHPFILFLTAWIFWTFIPKYKFFVIAFICVVITSSLILDWEKMSIKNSRKQYEQWEKQIIKTFPNQKIILHSYKYKDVAQFLPLSVYLSLDNLSDDKGRKVGLANASMSGQFTNFHRKIGGGNTGFQLLDLQSSSSAELKKEGWEPISGNIIYNETESWYKRHK